LVRKWLRIIIATVMYYTGLAFVLRRLGRRPQLRILMYHSISNIPGHLHSVSPAAFDEQMQFLTATTHVVPLEESIEFLRGEKALPANPIVITFDDGLLDNYTTAYPILKKYNLPATMFFVTKWIRPAATSQSKEDPSTGRRKMTWEQIRDMAANGITIGAHTVSHHSLTKLTPDEVRYELAESKRQLEQHLGKPVKFFAYPYGTPRDLNQEVMRLVAETGYICATTSLSGVSVGSANLYALRRTEIEATDGMYVFRKVIAGALDLWILLERLKWMRLKLRGK
jgi:peptidoglycan/xylan/chitin deacetylase (PgdA/CDA1 family)